MQIEDRPRDDGFEATFVVRTPRDKVWELLASATPAADVLPPPEPGQRWMPGWEAPADDIEVVPGESLRTRKARQPCIDTEIVIRLEDEATGTRITLIQTGFGAGFDQARSWLSAGWWTIVTWRSTWSGEWSWAATWSPGAASAATWSRRRPGWWWPTWSPVGSPTRLACKPTT